METITVTIGRNAGAADGAPLPSDVWNHFVADTREAFESVVAETWAQGPTRNVWGDTPEDGFVFYGPLRRAEGGPWRGNAALGALRSRLATLAAYYGQEAVGLSLGLSELVESVALPGARVPALVES